MSRYNPPKNKKGKEKMAKATKKVEYDLNVLKKHFEDNKTNESQIALALIKKAIFIDRKLSELEEDIDANGLNVEMQQGNYSITRANPSINSYNTFIKNYNTIVKQIVELLPKNEENEEENEFSL